ncbi:MAG: NADH-quinone oxidoreductase subunit NuoE [Candidatus Bathyarchaeia archaeon]
MYELRGVSTRVLNEEEIDSLVDKIFKSKSGYSPRQSALIPILQDVQKEVGYLPQRALKRISEYLGTTPSHVYGVATFYHQFRLRPEGKHIITICRGTACHVAGSSGIYDFLMRHLKVTPPEDTTSDGIFTVQQVRCIGACSLAPIMKVDNDVYGKLNPNKILRILNKYKSAGKEEEK